MTIGSADITPSLLWEALTSWENLLLAFRRAARGKRGRLAAANFDHQVADRLIALQADLRHQRYLPGAYTNFTIHEFKRRRISAAPFRDRVVHHALCNVIEPLFEREFASQSYANRVGKGTHRALDRLQALARHFRYVLRGDVVQHFPSIDHAILRAELARVLGDQAILWLVDRILASGEDVLRAEYTMVYFPGDDLFAALRPRGLPIGNLTSQFWSNCYLNPFDWFVVRELGCRGYLRYVDDFALFSDNKRELLAWKGALIDRLAGLRLTLHDTAAQPQQTAGGIPWLGFIIYRDHRRLKRRNAVNFARRLRHNVALYDTGAITFAELDASIQGWVNHVRYADTWGLRRHILGDPATFNPRSRAAEQYPAENSQERPTKAQI